MRPAILPDPIDQALRPERRVAPPLSSLPVNSITSESDPTLEIRTLIEQLQHAARDARTRLRESEQEREQIHQQLEGALLQIDELRGNERELRSHFTEVATTLRERDQAIADAERYAQAATRAREELSKLTRQRDEALRQREEIAQQLDSLARTSTETGERSAEIQKQLANLRAARDSSHAQNVELSQRIKTLDDELAELGYQRDALQKAQQQAADDGAKARQALDAAHQQIAELTRERDALRESAAETRLELEAQLVALRSQWDAADDPALPAADDTASSHELQVRLERQRLQSIELAAQLDTAQRQIREMSASLAEARLQVKFSAQAARSQPASGQTPGKRVRPAAISLAELLLPMRECFASYASSPGEIGRLLELHDRIVTYAERARLSDHIALYRLAHSFASLLESLAVAPGQVNASMLNTIGQTIEFFASLGGDSVPERFRDPAQARVLVVDDDAGNCQCVQLVMQEQMIQATTSQDPTGALMELASDPFDLIFLDVNMPHMSGFELCRRLRELPQHHSTPVVFLTGLATDERREQSLLSGGNDFLGKPFNLHELTVKALTLILKNQAGLT